MMKVMLEKVIVADVTKGLFFKWKGAGSAMMQAWLAAL